MPLLDSQFLDQRSSGIASHGNSLANMDRPLPDPAKLLEEWMEWERGEATPGRVMANLKTAGLRDLLEHLVASTGAPPPTEPAEADTSAWTPTV
jgi:hypothetical protein